jgi:hypothetical protein
MANFSISDFQTEVRIRGLAKPNRFEISFPTPKGLADLTQTIWTNRLISLFCESANLPSKTIGVKQQRVYGPAYQRPFNSEYGGEGITMTFLLDTDMDVKGFFDAWTNIIVDPFQYFVHYADNYTVPITIFQLDEKDNITYAITLEDAFPRSVALLDLNNSTQNQVHKLNVTFSYRRWFPYHKIPNAVRYPEVWEQQVVNTNNPLLKSILENTDERGSLPSINTERGIIANTVRRDTEYLEGETEDDRSIRIRREQPNRVESGLGDGPILSPDIETIP